MRQHVELGYVQTGHATQGRTVDRSILYLDGRTDARGIYVPLTRGRHTNNAYIATTPDTDALNVFDESVSRIWIDQPAVARQTELAQTTTAGRPGTIAPAGLRDLLYRPAVIEGDLDANRDNLKQLPQRIDKLTRDIATTSEQQQQSMTALRSAEETLTRHDRPPIRGGSVSLQSCRRRPTARGLDFAIPTRPFSLSGWGVATNQPVEWRTTIIRGDRYRFVTDWSAGGRSELRPSAV